jgi:hypothetical protein
MKRDTFFGFSERKRATDWIFDWPKPYEIVFVYLGQTQFPHFRNIHS